MQWVDQGAKNDNGEVAFNTITRKAFCTNQAADFVAVVDLDNNFVVRYVKVGTGVNVLAAPHNVMVDAQGKYFYVTLIREGTVEKYDAITYGKLGTLSGIINPGHVIIMPNCIKGYVTEYDLNGLERAVKSFDAQTMTQINTISDITMSGSHGGRVTHDGKYLITVAELSEYVHITSTQNDSLESSIPVAQNVPPNGNGTGLYRTIAVSISPDDRYAFISCDKSNEIRVLDMQSRTITNIIQVGTFPIQSESTPDGRWLYVANRNSNSVSVIDVNTMTVFKTINNIGAQPHGVAITPDGHYAYVTCESVSGTYVHHPETGSLKPGTTAVIDILNGHVKVEDIEMGSFPAGISIMEK
jgi:YVTN family beta-propeller protein